MVNLFLHVQGDVQWRNWNMGNDLEQLLVWSGFTYSPEESNVLLTFSLANITSGAFGEETTTVWERRVYQIAMYPAKIGGRIFLNHRFRFEQIFSEGQDFKTRYRYNLFVNVPITNQDLEANTVYLVDQAIFLRGIL